MPEANIATNFNINMEKFRPKVYLASRFDRHQELLSYAKQLNMLDVDVTSEWLYSSLTESQSGAIHLSADQREETLNHEIATTDLKNIREAQALFLFTPGTVRAGLHVEFGYALALNKKVCVVGPRTNVFTHLEDVQHFCDFEDVKEMFAAAQHIKGYFRLEYFPETPRAHVNDQPDNLRTGNGVFKVIRCWQCQAYRKRESFVGNDSCDTGCRHCGWNEQTDLGLNDADYRLMCQLQCFFGVRLFRAIDAVRSYRNQRDVSVVCEEHAQRLSEAERAISDAVASVRKL